MTDPAIHSMYYVAIVCPPSADERIIQFKYWMRDRFSCVVALKSPAHITLIPPFWLDGSREEELLQLLGSFSHNNELQIHLQNFSHFGKRVLFVNVVETPALEEVRKQVEDHFMQLPGGIIRKDDRPFHPHVTIANRDMKPHHFFKAWEYFSKKEFDEQFTTATISLLKLAGGKWNLIAEKNWSTDIIDPLR